MIKLVSDQISKQNPQNSLPTPSSQELKQCQELAQEIIYQVQANNNWLSFRDYMNMALYHPLYGYYTAGKKKIGHDGDFITAPELGPLFSYGLSQQIQPILEAHQDFNILEFGAGTGNLAKSLLLELDKANALPEYYYIIEVSAELKDRQQKKLQALPDKLAKKVVWLNSLPADSSFNGVIIANEVIDAMPVNLFQYDNNLLTELGLTIINNNMVWENKKPEQKLCNYIEEHITPLLAATKSENISSYISEVNLLAKDWLESINLCLESGLIMIIDYGFARHEYYHHDRNQGTLMCHYQHYAHHDPLLYPGLQDITAHVDFTSLAETAVANDLDVCSYLNQGNFLIANNITHYFEQQKASDKIFKLKQDLKLLTNHSEMGELFKVLLLNKNIDFHFFEHLQRYDKRGLL